VSTTPMTDASMGMRTIIIQQIGPGQFTVIEGEKITHSLCWSELIGHIAARVLNQPGYTGKTVTEIEEEAERWEAQRITRHLRPVDRLLLKDKGVIP